MFEEDKEEPASVMVTSTQGQGFDIKNIPGFKRKQLIDSGQINLTSFVMEDNMPGAKLKKLRDAFKLNNSMTQGAPSISLIDITSLEEGSLVSYRNTVTEVKKINVEKGLVYINLKGNKKGWINVAKLKAVTIPPEDEE